MKLQGKITILINRDYTEIEIENASTRFVKVRLTPEQISACLSRQSSVECELEVRGLDKIGKKHENKTFEFEITEAECKNESLRYTACQQALKDAGMKEWISDDYYRSQNSFFTKGNKQYARVTIRRYI